LCHSTFLVVVCFDVICAGKVYNDLFKVHCETSILINIYITLDHSFQIKSISIFDRD